MIHRHPIRNPLNPTAGGRHGFTLLELVVSLFVFSIGILGVAVLQNQTIANHTFSENASQNNSVAVDQIEEFMAADWDDDRIAEDKDEGPIPAKEDDSVSLIYRIDGNVAIPGAKMIKLTAEYKDNLVASRKNPRIDIPIVKPFVK